MKKKEQKGSKKGKPTSVGIEFKDGQIAFFTGNNEVLGMFMDLIAYGLRPYKIEKNENRIRRRRNTD